MKNGVCSKIGSAPITKYHQKDRTISKQVLKYISQKYQFLLVIKTYQVFRLGVNII